MASKPLLPVIIVSDYTVTPPLGLHYHAVNGPDLPNDNIIIFSRAYQLIKSLLAHKMCSHNRHPIWPCTPCEANFTAKYWACAALLLDYFADFYAKDTAAMQAIWLYLFDVWQESVSWYPLYAAVPESEENTHATLQGTDKAVERLARTKARAFKKDIEDTLSLFEVVIWGRKRNASVATTITTHFPQEKILHDPNGHLSNSVGEYDTGSWISGLKPWAQFLSAGGPGVFPPRPLPPPPPASLVTRRYMPMPGIALLATRVAHARDLAALHYAASSVSSDTIVPSMQAFDAHSPVFPSPEAPEHTFVSPLRASSAAPRTVSYALGTGTPPILRYTGYADAELAASLPDWNLLDECVAICKGWPAYEAVGGGGDDDDEDMEVDGFDVWTMVETRQEKEEEEKEGRGEKTGGVLGPMFDTWCGIAECC